MTKINKIKKISNTILLVIAIISLTTVLIIYGFYVTVKQSNTLLLLQHVLALFFIVGLTINFFNAKSKIAFIKKHPIDFFITVFFSIFFIIQSINIFINFETFILQKETISNKDLYIMFLHLFLIISSFVAITKFRDFWLILPIRASRILVFSFFIIIVLGALLLKLPKANNNLSWIDAFFTSTSAVCVTGLSPFDIPMVLTFEGQVILLILIQIGGLGIITLTTFIAVFIQKGFRLKDQVLLKEIMDDEELNNISLTLIRIILITFSIEILGSIILFFSWSDFGFNILDRIFYAIFHSVSAYCNAGFSNYQIGMESNLFHNHTPTLLTIMSLVILGGIGFYTINFIIFNKNKSKNQGLKLQTKIILYTTLIFIVGGALFIWILQYKEWKDLSFGNQVLNSIFLSVTSRTAGFANLSIGQILVPTSFVIIFLMYIGAAPNSTAGGIKITTFVTLIYGVWAFIRGRDRVEIGWNTINMFVVRRSLVVFFISITLIFVAGFILSITENYLALSGHKIEFFDLFFETVSAFGTVGLSRNVTPFLSSIGKIVIIATMFLGRVGIFTMAIAIGEEKHHAHYKYPETNIMVG